ncbi:MAG: hypothetical protein ACR2HR_04955 [Euzebya sp.]
MPELIIEVVSSHDTDSDYVDRLGRARAHGVTEVILISPFTPGGVHVAHLQPHRSDPTRFRTVAASIDASDPILVPVIDVRISGGDRLRVIDEQGEWPSPGQAINGMRAEAARADQATARAERLAALLREAGIDPDAE